MQGYEWVIHPSWVHPRIRGEDLQEVENEFYREGSPPHTRGRFAHLSFRMMKNGFTPAYAGKIRLPRS